MRKFLLVLTILSVGVLGAANAQTRQTSAQKTENTGARAARTTTSTTAGSRATSTSGNRGTSQRAARMTPKTTATTERSAVSRRAGVVKTAAPAVTTTTTTTAATTTTTAKTEDEMTAAELQAAYDEKMSKVEAKLGVQSQCQEKFAECMDASCKDDTYGRCLCAASYSELNPLKKEIEQLNKETNALLQEELARAKMTEKEREFYEQQKISLNLKDESEEIEYGAVTAESLLADYKNAGQATGPKTGTVLFGDAHKACKPILDACPAESKAILTYYQNMANKECSVAKASLEEQKAQAVFARQKAEFTVKKAAYTTVSQKLDNATCLSELQALALTDSLCGKDYSKCLNCNEDFNGKTYKLELSNPADTTDMTSAYSKSFTGCAASNVQKMVARKEVYNTVLNKCQAPTVAWNTFMIDFASTMEKAERDQLFTYNTEQREKEFNVADTCQKDIDKCLKDICGTGYISCTAREKAANYNLALIGEENALIACNNVYARCDSRVQDAQNSGSDTSSIDVESIWTAAWKRAQNQADITYQKRLAALIKETADVTKAELKMESEIAEERARAENTQSRIGDVLASENALEDARLGAQLAKAELEEAKNKTEKEVAKQTAMNAAGMATAQRGCGKAAGKWEKNNCFWTVTAKGYTSKRGVFGREKSRDDKENVIKFAAGSKFTCNSATMGVPTDYGCSWDGGTVQNGQSYTFPSLEELSSDSDY